MRTKQIFVNVYTIAGIIYYVLFKYTYVVLEKS